MELIIGLLTGAILAGFGTFYVFHGRLSRVEGQLEMLRDAINRISQYPSIDGVTIPIPTSDRPVGGINVIAETLKKDPKEIQQEEIFTVFELVTDGQALTNLVLGEQVRINNITLKSLSRAATKDGDNAKYAAVISMENLTDQNIEFVIPKGQVFENREPQSGRQNLAAARGQRQTIAARRSFDLTVEAHCINKNLSPPSGNPGNLTIFKIRDDKFVGQAELWRSIDESLDKAKLVVEGRNNSTNG
jgi:hypothetical protein